MKESKSSKRLPHRRRKFSLPRVDVSDLMQQQRERLEVAEPDFKPFGANELHWLVRHPRDQFPAEPAPEPAPPADAASPEAPAVVSTSQSGVEAAAKPASKAPKHPGQAGNKPGTKGEPRRK